MKADLRITRFPGISKAKTETDWAKAAEVARHFRAYADSTGIHINGLQGLTIYVDSQFIHEWRRISFPEALKSFAYATYTRAMHERVVEMFPNHPLTRFSRDHLAKHEQTTA